MIEHRIPLAEESLWQTPVAVAFAMIGFFREQSLLNLHTLFRGVNSPTKVK